MRRIWSPVIVFALGFAIAGCGPATFTRTRTMFEPYAAAESRQEKEGVVAEIKFTRTIPQSFIATAQRCDRTGRLVIDPLGQPSLEKVSLAQSGQYWEQIALTNNTDHVLRMNSVVIRLFDPAANQIEPLNWGDLQSELMAARPCPSSIQAIQMLRINKVFDRNMEIVPGTTATFWLAFRPPSMQMPGTWKLAIYEVPISVDSAGRPTRTTKFDMRIVAKQIVETLTQDSPFSPPRVVESKDTSGGQVSQQTVPATPQQMPATQQTTATQRATESSSPAVRSDLPKSASQRQADTGTPSKAAIVRAQVRLKELGFDPGGADGSLGPRSMAAIRRFQSAKGIPATGQLSHETMEALGVTE